MFGKAKWGEKKETEQKQKAQILLKGEIHNIIVRLEEIEKSM